jgi:uncharacterized repeat protein (TIGR03806 family)
MLFRRVASLVVLLVGWSTIAGAVSDPAILAPRPPALLSGFGFFADLATQRPADHVIPFAPSTPLYSDGALKARFVYVPTGKTATYVENEAFEFPVGSALIKTFSFPDDVRRPGDSIRKIETRVLLKQEAGWQAWAYLWNEQQTDAQLNIVGARVDISLLDDAGQEFQFTYAVPNKNQCKTCHEVAGAIVPLGPKGRNLDFGFDYPKGRENQLDHWQAVGILDGLPGEGRTGRSVPDWQDPSADLDARARAWLDANCAHCHQREGSASNTGLYLGWDEPYGPALGINKRPVAAGRGSGGFLFDIKPGDPDASILNYRVESVEPGVMMPELGRVLADKEAATLLRDWVESLK